MSKEKNRYRVIGVSWSSQELLDQGRKRAASLGLSFSGYINQLVRRDVERQGEFVIEPADGKPERQINSLFRRPRPETPEEEAAGILRDIDRAAAAARKKAKS